MVINKTIKYVAVLSLLAITLISALSVSSVQAFNEKCFPKVDTKQPQYLIGYGDLMLKAAREKKFKGAEVKVAVLVAGYQRGWFVRLKAKAPFRTILGVEEDKGKSFNGLVLSTSLSQIKDMDRKAALSCRQEIKVSALKSMTSEKLPKSGQYWMFIDDKEHMEPAAESYPILLSDVDIFLTGCIEQAEAFNLPKFSEECIKKTSNWSEHLRNDRMLPASLELVQNKRVAVDKLLEKFKGTLFERVRAE